MEFQQKLTYLARVIDWHLEPQCKHNKLPLLNDELCKLTVQPFRLLKLPQELQDLIYSKYFEGIQPFLPKTQRSTLGHEHSATVQAIIKQSAVVSCKQPACHVKGRCRCRRQERAPKEQDEEVRDLPCLNLELTCRKVFRDVRQVRDRQWPRSMKFDVSGWARFAQPNAEWLQQRLTKLFLTTTSLAKVNQYSTRYLSELAQTSRSAVVWRKIVKNCPQLRLIFVQAEREFLATGNEVTINYLLNRVSDSWNIAAGNDLSLHTLPRALSQRRGEVKIRFRSLVVFKPSSFLQGTAWLLKVSSMFNRD